jgi:3-deoxy-manno-octulosonate cytidylyltransferase (CMP-KDO synthetase)
MKTIVVIPARLESSRLKEKVLMDLKGKTMLQRVFERVQLAKVDEVYIATDSEKIAKAAQKFTANVEMTASSHRSGTDRIAELARRLECDYIINVQGDEPLIEISLIEKLANALFTKQAEFVTAAYPLQTKEQILDTSKVKVVFNHKNQAMYFSRSAIPYSENFSAQYYCHIGVYGYSKDFLLKYTSLPPSKLEKAEKLEQMRALESGYPLSVILTKQASLGVDTAEDLQEVLNFFVD